MIIQPEDRPPLSTLAKIAIYTGVVFSIALCLFSAISVVGGLIFMLDHPGLPSVGLFVGLIVLTGLLVRLTRFLHSFVKEPAPQSPTCCQCCGTAVPTMKVGLNRHIGAILLMFHKSLHAHLCKVCIRRTFWEYTAVTFLLGWWGLISVFVTPIVLINNIVVFIRTFSMPSVDEPTIESVIRA